MKLPPVVDRIAKEKEGKAQVPICILMVGMAGSGKTTLMAQLQQSSIDNQDGEEEESAEGATTQQEDHQQKEQSPTPAYCLNLDPATIHLPYNVSIDIRDTVDYKVGQQ